MHKTRRCRTATDFTKATTVKSWSDYDQPVERNDWFPPFTLFKPNDPTKIGFMLREFNLIALLTALGTAYSLVSGLAPLPWAEPELRAGEIRLDDAEVIDVIWVDARNEGAYAEAHAPEALFYDQADPTGSMGTILEQWLMQPRVIVIYCADEGCGTSRKIAEELRTNLPDAEIYSLKGGWSAWSE